MIPCSHVAASAARSRRDHCLLWARLATPAAGRCHQVHLHAPVLHDVHPLLDSLTQLDELHKTVQQRVDDVPKWSVQMYPKGDYRQNVTNLDTTVNKPSRDGPRRHDYPKIRLYRESGGRESGPTSGAFWEIFCGTLVASGRPQTLTRFFPAILLHGYRYDTPTKNYFL